MNQPKAPTAMMPSVMDRLLDDTPAMPNGFQTRSAIVASIRRTILRDLEWLLNSRRRPLDNAVQTGLPELKTSLLGYGMPDFTALDLGSEARRNAFTHMLETVIRTFEPRFAAVSVTIFKPQAGSVERSLRFRIEALIRVGPAAEPVIFESLLDPTTRTFAIRSFDHE